jgi:hypothetical protein
LTKEKARTASERLNAASHGEETRATKEDTHTDGNNFDDDSLQETQKSEDLGMVPASEMQNAMYYATAPHRAKRSNNTGAGFMCQMCRNKLWLVACTTELIFLRAGEGILGRATHLSSIAATDLCSRRSSMGEEI